MSVWDELARRILAMERSIEQLDRRLNNVIREAVVTEVDATKGLARVEAHGLKSAWSPWVERAGTIRTWSPPTVGERVLFVSPSGEPGQGLILSGGFSDQFAQAHDKEGEHKMQVGDATVLVKGDLIELKRGDTVAEVAAGFCRGKKGDARFVASDAGAKIRKGNSWVVVTGEKVIVSTAPEEGPDPDGN